MVYQMSVDGLADRLGIPLEQAEYLFARFWAAYPRIRAWTQSVVAQARRQHYLITKFGRRVPIWEYEDAMTALAEGNRKRARTLEGAADRLAGNAPVQGGAADYVKIAMVRAHRALEEAGFIARGVKLAMNIHDALEWYVPDSIPAGDVIKVLLPAVVFPVDGWPPMEAEWHMWRKWGSAKDIEFHPVTFQVRLKGEEAPVEQVNADEDDEAPEVAQVAVPDLGPLKAEVTSRPPVHGPQKQVVIEVPGMSQGEFTRLLGYVREVPGPHLVAVRLPDGDVPIPGTWSLTPDDEPQLALLVEGGCSVFYDGERPSQLQEVAAGLVL